MHAVTAITLTSNNNLAMERVHQTLSPTDSAILGLGYLATMGRAQVSAHDVACEEHRRNPWHTACHLIIARVQALWEREPGPRVVWEIVSYVPSTLPAFCTALLQTREFQFQLHPVRPERLFGYGQTVTSMNFIPRKGSRWTLHGGNCCTTGGSLCTHL